ncbi:prolipoprotein diacylglyceryl transferase [bacterium]|nr:prolipoprotein diacylglyceryl transferase [bacterium]
MLRVLLELRDNQAAWLAGFLFTFFWMFFVQRRSFRTTRDLVIACVILLAGTAGIGWLAYMLAYANKIFGGDAGVDWDLALSFFTGGRGIYPIRSYGIAMASAFGICIPLMYRRAPKEGLSQDTTVNVALLTIVGTLVGGRVLFVITQWEKYTNDLLGLIRFWEGGLVFYGGAIGAAIATGIYLKFVRKEGFLRYGDLVSPYTGLGLAIHRGFGCFLNGCCYGGPTNAAWGVHFPLDHPGTKFFGAEVYLHPSQLYEAINGLLIFGVLMAFRSRRKYVGQSWAIMMMMYAFNRYLVEMTRGDLLRGTVGVLSTSQFISIVIFALGAVLLAFCHVRKIPAVTEAPVPAAARAAASRA